MLKEEGGHVKRGRGSQIFFGCLLWRYGGMEVQVGVGGRGSCYKRKGSQIFFGCLLRRYGSMEVQVGVGGRGSCYKRKEVTDILRMSVMEVWRYGWVGGRGSCYKRKGVI